jgi:glycopeptide antibiotics resistance protein
VIRRHPALSVVALIYFAALAWTTLTPAPFGGARTALMAQAARILRRNAPTSWVTQNGLEFASNVVLFIPLGLLLVLMLGRRHWFGVLFVGLITSCWIELAQSVWLPMREADPRYIAAHVAGTTLGIVIAILGSRKHAGQKERTALSPVSQSSGSQL